MHMRYPLQVQTELLQVRHCCCRVATHRSSRTRLLCACCCCKVHLHVID